MRALDAVRRALELAFRGLTGIAFAVLIASVTVQVIGRLAGASPVWTEELTRVALLYLAAFGAGLGIASGDLVDVDVVRAAVPGRVARAMRIASLGTTAALCIALLPAAWLYTSIGARQSSPALGVRMDLVHASVLVLLAALGLFALLGLARALAGDDPVLDRAPDVPGVPDTPDASGAPDDPDPAGATARDPASPDRSGPTR